MIKYRVCERKEYSPEYAHNTRLFGTFSEAWAEATTRAEILSGSFSKPKLKESEGGESGLPRYELAYPDGLRWLIEIVRETAPDPVPLKKFTAFIPASGCFRIEIEAVNAKEAEDKAAAMTYQTLQRDAEAVDMVPTGKGNIRIYGGYEAR